MRSHSSSDCALHVVIEQLRRCCLHDFGRPDEPAMVLQAATCALVVAQQVVARPRVVLGRREIVAEWWRCQRLRWRGGR